MEAQQPRYRVYEDSGKIIKLNLSTKESRSIWPKELEQQIERGTVPDFWNDEQVLALLKKMPPRVRTSEVFAARISETKEQIANLEADLAKIPTRKTALLAQEEIDQPALHAFHRTLREYRVRPETPADTLWTQLRRARLDDYQRHTAKTSRAYPRKKHRPPIGIPLITLATDHQIAQAVALHDTEEFRLAA
jgi:hypothetical protein